MGKWVQYDKGRSIGTIGSEGGTIVKDQEYDSCCWITLEECKDRMAITCGIYGCMVHTAFCEAENAEDMYESMKNDLSTFISKDTTENEQYIFYRRFTRKY